MSRERLQPVLQDGAWLCAWLEDGVVMGHCYNGRTWKIDESSRSDHKLMNKPRLLREEMIEQYGEDYETV